ncbi:helix-turn-helix transcriptional regulator [Paraburkholderia sp. JPY303]|uniref:helix-turn-helix transcriptional regulator n=1 Tax=Paraburkholderia atlantica TaxID=2654982 RepID=UPI001591C6D4|nr:helix-turn-helix transcriptional regulator [Paraburkholderia atlantica]NUY33897.1 helix-turn-helix transcriptional regulator [Paraburkholderia atlantica]
MGKDNIHFAIQRIYEAVLAPQAWEEAAASIVTAIGADWGFLIATQGGVTALSVSAGLELVLARGLQREFQKRLPEWIKNIPVGTPRRQSTEISDSDFKLTHIYNEVVKPANMFYGLVLPVSYSDTRQVYFSAGRHLGAIDFGEADLSAATMIAPHLAAALNAHSHMVSADLRANGAFDLLMRLNIGVVLLDSKAQPVFVNPYAEALCEPRDGLIINHQEVSALVLSDAKNLRDTIGCTIDTNGDRAAPRCYVSRRSPRLPLIVRAIPVMPFDSADGVRHNVCATLLIFDPERPVAVNQSDVAKTFGLTPREAEFAALLARGHDVDEAALMMGIKSETAREYLKDIEGKTQTHRQSQLVSLLLRGGTDIFRE